MRRKVTSIEKLFTGILTYFTCKDGIRLVVAIFLESLKMQNFNMNFFSFCKVQCYRHLLSGVFWNSKQMFILI